MDVLKIRAVSARPSVRRNLEFLTSFFGKRGVTIEVDWVDAASAEEAAIAVKEATDHRSVRINPDLSIEALALCPSLPLDVSSLQAADVLFSRQRGWEPALCTLEGVRESLVTDGKTLDQRLAAYVIGKGGYLRSVAGAVLGLGYRQVYLVSDDESDLNAQKKILERVYVGSDCVVLPSYQLTLQTVGASLVINATDLTSEKDLASDVAYFNFMTSGGLVVDLEDPSETNPLLEEAVRAGLRILPTHQVLGWIEWAHVKGLCLDSLCTPAEFINGYFEYVRQLSKT